MIIDLILDRKDDDELIAQGYTHRQAWNGKLIPLEFNPHKFYREVMEYSKIFDGIGDKITAAMDYGTDDDVKAALCDYIQANDYNPDICDYINAVNWI